MSEHKVWIYLGASDEPATNIMISDKDDIVAIADKIIARQIPQLANISAAALQIYSSKPTATSKKFAADQEFHDLSLQADSGKLKLWVSPSQVLLPPIDVVIRDLQSKYPELKGAFQSAKIPQTISMDLPWTGRKEDVKKILLSLDSNRKNFEIKQKNKQSYEAMVIIGGIGVGKSRLGHEATSIFLSTTKNYKHSQLFIDFSVGDNFKSDQPRQSDVILGLRIAAHYFFGVSLADMLLLDLPYDIPWAEFKFRQIMKIISLDATPKSPIMLTLQLDEFQELAALSKNLLNEIMYDLANHMVLSHNLNVCLNPVFSGTASIDIISAISCSRMNPLPYQLMALPEKDALALVVSAVPNEKRKLIGNAFFKAAVASLGGVPRFIQFFIEALSDSDYQRYAIEDVSTLLSDILTQVAKRIVKNYSIEKWNLILGNSKVALRTMVLWALGGHPVSLEDKLNGINIQQAKESGILMLVNAAPDHPDKYKIYLPLVLLKALNRKLRDVPDALLDPVKTIGWSAFENAMFSLRMFRQQLLISLDKTVTTYSEIYPFAYGTEDTLNRRILLRPLTLVFARGYSSSHDSIHKHKMSEVPIFRSVERSTVDLTKGGYIVKNVEKAPSFDAFIEHPAEEKFLKAQSEYMQIKSSEKIGEGEDFDASSQGYLTLSDVNQEWNKVKDYRHKKFSGESEFILVILSNKPFKKIEDISNIPSGVIVVCEQNFVQFAGSFAHRALYQNITSKDELFPSDDDDEDYVSNDEDYDEEMEILQDPLEEEDNPLKDSMESEDLEELKLFSDLIMAYNAANDNN